MSGLIGMAGALAGVGGFLLKLRGGQPKPLERVGRAEVANEAERANREETSRVIDARRAADERRLREQGAGARTTDPAAAINRDDGFRRD